MSIKCNHTTIPSRPCEDCLRKHHEELANVSPAPSCSPHDLPEVMCEDCGWTGDAPDLIERGCPDCNSSDIIDYEPEENQKGQRPDEI